MSPSAQSFETLRVRVEARIPLPALVVLSAAHRGDGTTSVACGLARAFAAGGARTLLVDANAGNAAVAAELGVEPLPALSGGAFDLGARNGEVPRLSLATLSAEAAREPNLDALLRDARDRFAVTIVDAAPLPASSAALRLARRADAIVFAVRLGRRPSPDDREATDLAGDRLIGIVPTRARGLRDYRAIEQPAPAVPALHAIVPAAGAVN
jgi:Mrp family chromosome partitioning ATPase